MAGERLVVTVVFVVTLSASAMSFCTLLDVKNVSQTTTERYSFEQPLDHLDPDSAVFNQVFWERCDLYEEGGPVFLSIGGFEPITDPWPNNSALQQYGTDHKALIFKVEHRFYGGSIPKNLDGKGSLELENLKYLTSFQALADLANFIQTMNRMHPLLKGRDRPPRWVAFGCFYAGSLASWLRSKYPHLVYAAVASSAPLMAKHDSPEYMDEIANSIETQKKDCGTEVRLAMYSIKQNMGRLLCNLSLANMSDTLKDRILLRLAKRTARVAQQEGDIMKFCDIMLNKDLEDPVARFISGLEGLELDMVEECLNDNTCIESYNNTSWAPDYLCPMYRQFKYQQCSEFGHFQTLQTTGNCPPTFSSHECTSIFGKNFTEFRIMDSIARTNMLYGGLDLEASRVVSIHGSLDPWRTVGLSASNNAESPVFIIEGAVQCADQRRPSAEAPPEIKTVQAEVSNILHQWLQGGWMPPPSAQDQGQDPWKDVDWYLWLRLLIGLLIGCALVVGFVVLRFKKTGGTLQL